MALSKSTILLCPVIVLQFLVCICRHHHADVLGMAKDGVVIIAGIVTVYEATATPALLYAALCFSGIFYDAIISMQWLGWWWMTSRISYANLKGVAELLEVLLVAVAPIVSAVGAVLAGRIYFQSRAGSHAERHPLRSSATGECYSKDGQGGAAASAPPHQCGTTPGDFLAWPTAPAMPLPLVQGGHDVTRSPPFRAIFGTPLLKSPRSALAERTPNFHLEEVGAVL